MELIFKLLEGSLSIPDFMYILEDDEKLQFTVNSLIPLDAKIDENNVYWTECVGRNTLERFDFNVVNYLLNRYGYGDSIGDKLNIYGYLQKITLWIYPNVTCTKKYNDEYSLVINTTPDYIDGKDVRPFIEKIISDTEDIRPKSARVKMIKKQIYESFHLADQVKKPRWIQDPEWPLMGGRPMLFVSQKRDGEKVVFIFKDVLSDRTVNVIQYY
jgi:hypothetical protein